MALPELGGDRDGGAGAEADGVLGADGAADATAITASGIDGNLMIGGAVGDGPELAETHTLPTARTGIGIHLADIFGAEHDRDGVGDRAAHGQAVRTVAVADAGNERRTKGPDGMAEAFAFVIAQRRDCLGFAEFLCVRCVGPGEKTLVEVSDDFVETATVGSQRDPIAVTFLLAQRNVPADAGHTNDLRWAGPDHNGAASSGPR